MLKLKKAVAWIHNKSNKDVIIGDLDIKVPKGKTINLFKVKHSLSYELYLKSKREGSLFKKSHELVETEGPPEVENFHTTFVVSDEPIASRGRSVVEGVKRGKDILEFLEEEFPPDSGITQEEIWKAERNKMIKTLDELEQGDDGEVFSDNIFDDNSEDLDGFDY